MYSIVELEMKLENEQAKYELIKQNEAIYSIEDAKKYYKVEKAAPTFILQCEDGLIACIVSACRGKLDFDAMKKQFGYSKLKMANREKVEKQTGYKIGSVPLIGLNLPCIFDNTLLQFDYIYGGTGNELITLKIDPHDVIRLNNVINFID
ncbi:aminoacyl-tRNA deacylase [Anaerosacchariphilus polymeriproducens]|uniref:YbaK/aminoacyl-tRNA synthetase-associated domain-containing protein n=1 Tax=Anaerosacchariphilus polymeriproducens TaxID=1812858 RepID=A0A371AZC3_9FIRM|nr:YbaK/EbsC family protein [Anaerosacchariphilus polymeriproducens]RDU24911.1 hypothetical protein DWV06_01380 [Anaerosacchariphilus polymeriproducens]